MKEKEIIKKFKQDILGALFFVAGNESMRLAGYCGIVYDLMTKGKCISTIQAKDIMFGKCQEFITIKPCNEGVDLIAISFDKKKCMKSAVYKEELNRQLKAVKQWRNNAVYDLKDAQRSINNFDLIIDEFDK